MRKHLSMLAAATLAFAACTSDEVAVNPDSQQQALNDGAVVFDTYVNSNSSAKTRSTFDGNYLGYGQYTNTELQGGGFGVFASYYEGNEPYANLATKPSYNFMYNQLVEYSGAAGWTYEPLLYWPNETSKNSDPDGATDTPTGNNATAPHLDRVSFFAYAPYVAIDYTKTDGLNHEDGAIFEGGTEKDTNEDFGNVLMPAVDATAVPSIQYNVASTPAQSEDLLWAVAPYGGLKYTAVNGDQIDIAYGNSFVDLVKPAVNTKIKFLFQHALAALKMSIVAAIDEVEAKETTQLDDNTKIFVNKITIKSNDANNGFATQGTLSLLNRNNGLEPNLPNWTITKTNATAGNTSLIISGIDSSSDLLNDADIQLNPELFSGLDIVGGDEYTDGTWNFDAAEEGVTEEEKGVFVEEDGFADDLLMFIPVLKDDYKYNTASNLSVTVTIDYDVVTKGSNVDGGLVVVNNKISKVISLPKYRNGRIYKLKLILGMTSVQLEAEASDWTEVGQEVDLPRNLD